MDELLRGLQSEGRLDSKGVFTVDLDRAFKVLERLTLLDPQDWILKAIQSAVALGASKIDIVVHERSVSLRHDGEPYSAEGLRVVDSNPSTLEGWASREFVVALQALRGLGAQRVALVTAYDEAAWLHNFTVQGRGIPTCQSVRLESWPFANEDEGSSLVAEFSLALEVEAIGELIRRRCLYCPSEITVNGKPVVAYPYGDAVVVVAPTREWSPWSILARPSKKSVLAGAVWDEEGHRVALPHDGSGEILATTLCALTYPPYKITPGVHFVHLGVLLDAVKWSEFAWDEQDLQLSRCLGQGSILRVRSTQGFLLDASGQKVVRNEASRAVLSDLRVARREISRVLRVVDPASQLLI